MLQLARNIEICSIYIQLPEEPIQIHVLTKPDGREEFRRQGCRLSRNLSDVK